MSQIDLFAGQAPAASCETPTPDAVRPRLHALLEKARNASVMPWEETRARATEHLFHNMANWLPDAEGEALRAAFKAEMTRLQQA